MCVGDYHWTSIKMIATPKPLDLQIYTDAAIRQLYAFSKHRNLITTQGVVYGDGNLHCKFHDLIFFKEPHHCKFDLIRAAAEISKNIRPIERAQYACIKP